MMEQDATSMEDPTDMPVVACDEDWLELADGERCILRGRLYGDLRPGDDSLIVSMSSWEIVAVGVDDGYSNSVTKAGSAVTVVARRTEDGLSTDTKSISIQQEK